MWFWSIYLGLLWLWLASCHRKRWNNQVSWSQVISDQVKRAGKLILPHRRKRLLTRKRGMQLQRLRPWLAPQHYLVSLVVSHYVLQSTGLQFPTIFPWYRPPMIRRIIFIRESVFVSRFIYLYKNWYGHQCYFWLVTCKSLWLSSRYFPIFYKHFCLNRGLVPVIGHNLELS